jgi:hypothetical protein
VDVVQTAWQSGVWWLQWLPLTFLLLQYPLSAVGLLAFNWPQQGVSRLQSIWPTLVLSATLWLVDLSAVFILLASSVKTVATGLQGLSARRCCCWWLWWLLLPLEYLYLVTGVLLHRLLPILHAVACLGVQLPAVDQVLQPKVGEEEVWAENHMFARMPMEALLEALPQVVLQVVAFFLAGDDYKPSLLGVMFSVTFSLISMSKAVSYIFAAGQSVRLNFWQAGKLLLQLQGSYRVPAAYMQGGVDGLQETPLTRIQMPPAKLSPLQEAGFLRAKLSHLARHRQGSQSSEWEVATVDLQHIQLPIKHDLAVAELSLAEVLQELEGGERQAGLRTVNLTNCATVR